MSLESGYDFLGFNIRRYRNGKPPIKPSKAAVRRVKRNLATEMRRLRGQNASAVLAAICRITRGWASFYWSVVSKKTFSTLDDHLGSSLTSGPAAATRQAEALDHQTVLRPVQPVQAEQLGVRRRCQRRLPAPARLDPHHPAPQGHRPGLPRRTRPDQRLEPAARHDPAPLDRSTLRLLKAQHGRCAICADLLLHAEREPHTPGEWQRWHRTIRKAITRQLIARGQALRRMTPVYTHLLPTPGNRRGSQEPASSRT